MLHMEKMYSIRILPAARRDMTDISRYIGTELANPAAADRLTEEMISAITGLSDMPYKCPVFFTHIPLRYEYRKLIVRNYIVFYLIDEDSKTVKVTRVLFARQDHANYLE